MRRAFALPFALSFAVSLLVAGAAGSLHAQSSAALRSRISAVAIAEGFDPATAFALIAIESAFDTAALGRNGPVGLMQIKPGTAATVIPGIKRSALFDPETNVRVGLRYLRSLMKRYDGDLEKGLRAYKGGPRLVDGGGGYSAASNSYIRRFYAARTRYATEITRATFGASAAAVAEVFR